MHKRRSCGVPLSRICRIEGLMMILYGTYRHNQYSSYPRPTDLNFHSPTCHSAKKQDSCNSATWHATTRPRKLSRNVVPHQEPRPRKSERAQSLSFYAAETPSFHMPLRPSRSRTPFPRIVPRSRILQDINLEAALQGAQDSYSDYGDAPTKYPAVLMRLDSAADNVRRVY